jgi:hypothetical protein
MKEPNNAPYPNTDGVKSQSVILLKVKRKNFNDACFSRYPWGGDPFRCLSQLEAAKIMQLLADKTQSESGHFQVAPGHFIKDYNNGCSIYVPLCIACVVASHLSTGHGGVRVHVQPVGAESSGHTPHRDSFGQTDKDAKKHCRAIITLTTGKAYHIYWVAMIVLRGEQVLSWYRRCISYMPNNCTHYLGMLDKGHWPQFLAKIHGLETGRRGELPSLGFCTVAKAVRAYVRAKRSTTSCGGCPVCTAEAHGSAARPGRIGAGL